MTSNQRPSSCGMLAFSLSRYMITMPYLGLAAFLALNGPSPALAQNADMPVEEVERIVRDYLMREPEIIYEAIQILQDRRAEAEKARQTAAIAARAEVLFRSETDPFMGNPRGDVTLVEFMDYRCGYCRSMVPALLALVAEDPDLKLVFKEFPILGPESELAARAALAAQRQGHYDEMHTVLMQSKVIDEEALQALAEEIGIDTDQLFEDMQSDEITRIIEENRALASELGISGTPAFVIGDQLIPGAAPIAQLVQKIEDERLAGVSETRPN